MNYLGSKTKSRNCESYYKKTSLLLADEPAASLDPKAANLIMSLLKKLMRNLI